MKFQASNNLDLLQINSAYLKLILDGLFLSNPNWKSKSSRRQG